MYSAPVSLTQHYTVHRGGDTDDTHCTGVGVRHHVNHHTTTLTIIIHPVDCYRNRNRAYIRILILVWSPSSYTCSCTCNTAIGHNTAVATRGALL